MFLTYRYKLRPAKAQYEALASILEAERLLYNAALQERRDAWRLGKVRITNYDQCKSLTVIREANVGYSDVPVNLSRWTLGKVHEAYQAFFKRAKAKSGKAGYPRFKPMKRWRSFGFSEFSGIRLKGDRLYFKGMPGSLKIHMHREIPPGASLKSCVFTREDRHWFVAIQLEIADFVGPHRRAGEAIGIDLNVLNRAVDSDGAVIENPRIGAAMAPRMRCAQRAVARGKKDSKRRLKAVQRLQGLHRKAKNRRKTVLHQASARIARDYGVIAVEDLKMANMTRSAKGTLAEPGVNVRQKAGLNRELLDVAPATFKSMLAYKAERAGGRVIEVKPHGTSIECSGCGERVPKRLSTRVHRCPSCGLTMDRDHNAARNILFRAQAVVDLWSANVDRSAA
jgi:putative transposase